MINDKDQQCVVPGCGTDKWSTQFMCDGHHKIWMAMCEGQPWQYDLDARAEFIRDRAGEVYLWPMWM